MTHAPPAETLAAPLLAWYGRSGRQFPWRGLRDPYPIWVSEVILQQTRVETGLRYFEPFLERFPTVQALAAASEAEVLAAWSGLGFYRRARNLHAGARLVVERFDGVVPTDPELLGELPGVGRYTVGAILSAAFNQRLPILDGNVIRVLSRVFLVEGAPDRAAVKRELWGLAEAVLPHDRPGDFNQAVMDLGATVCTPTGPRCGGCPLADVCRAVAEGRTADLPAPTKRAKVVFEQRVAVLVQRQDGRFLLRQRPPTGLLASLWELPAEEADEDAAEQAAEELVAGFAGGMLAACGVVEHRFSHRHWTTRVFRARGGDGYELGQRERWVELGELAELGLPTVSRKTIEAALAAQLRLI